MKTLKMHAAHAITGFELSKKTLNNLSQFNLKPIAKLVLLYLCDCYNPKHGEMFPKQSTIAAKLGVSEASVIRAVQELHKEGLIISERKYTNRYKFTPKIVAERSQNEDFNLQEETTQNISSETCKMTAHDKEKITEKNQPTKVDEFKILKNYAEKQGARNTTAYINALKRNGSAVKIISEYKEKQAADRYYQRLREENARRLAELKAIVPENPKDCPRLKEVLKQLRK